MSCISEYGFLFNLNDTFSIRVMVRITCHYSSKPAPPNTPAKPTERSKVQAPPSSTIATRAAPSSVPLRVPLPVLLPPATVPFRVALPAAEADAPGALVLDLVPLAEPLLLALCKAPSGFDDAAVKTALLTIDGVHVVKQHWPLLVVVSSSARLPRKPPAAGFVVAAGAVVIVAAPPAPPIRRFWVTPT
jgi:hypothetical protein